MAKVAGRKVKLYAVSGATKTLVAGGRGHSVTINNEPIDVTDKGDDGWRTLLGDAATRSVDIGFEGLMDGAALIDLALGPNTSALLSDYEVVVEGIGSFAGNFHLSSIEIGTPHDGAAEMSGTLASSGVITWTVVGGGSA